MMKTQEELLQELLEEVRETRRYVVAVHKSSQEVKKLVEELLVKEEE